MRRPPFRDHWIDPAYERPVRFSGSEFIRIGENKRRLAEFPSMSVLFGSAWARRRFESAVAEANVTSDQVFAKLDLRPASSI